MRSFGMFHKDFKPAYAKNLTNFIASWRRDLKTPGLRFYIGELCTKTVWGMDNRENMHAIRTAQKAVADADPLVDYIPTSHDAVEIGGGYDEFAVFNGGAEWPSAGLHDSAKDTAAFIKANRDKPFFINCWLHESHTPHVPTPDSMEKRKHLDEQKQVYSASHLQPPKISRSCAALSWLRK